MSFRTKSYARATTVKDAHDGAGYHRVLRDVSFDIAPGEMIGLVGPSGSGKSVLLKLLAGVLTPTAGAIEFSDERHGGTARVGLSFQEGGLFDSMTVWENVAFPLLQRKHEGVGREEAFAQAREVLTKVGLGKALEKVPGQLSGGMRRRVGIARALVDRPDLVLLDDPTGGLDPVAARVIIELVGALHASYNPAVVMVSHDLRRLLPFVGRVLALFGGVLVDDLPIERVPTEAKPAVLSFLKTRYDFDREQVAG